MKKQQIKRLPKKSRPASRRSTAMAKPLTPSNYRSTLFYYDYFNFASGGAAAFHVQVFRLNSPRDPLYAVGGGSCTGFDKLATLFNRIRVLSVDVRYWGYNTCISPLTYGIRFRQPNGANLYTGIGCQQTLFEVPSQCVSTTVVPYSAGTAYPKFSLRASRSVREILGHDDRDDDYGCLVTSDPSKELYIDIVMCSSDGIAYDATSNVHVQIAYHVEMSEPKQDYVD